MAAGLRGEEAARPQGCVAACSKATGSRAVDCRSLPFGDVVEHEEDAMDLLGDQLFKEFLLHPGPAVDEMLLGALNLPTCGTSRIGVAQWSPRRTEIHSCL